MGDRTGPSPFRYHLELTPAQLKVLDMALRSLLDLHDPEERELDPIIREILGKLPDEHAMRAIRLDEEAERATESPGPHTPPHALPEDDPPDSVA